MAMRGSLATIPDPDPTPEIGKWLEVSPGNTVRVLEKFLNADITLEMAISLAPNSLMARITRVPKNNSTYGYVLDGYEVRYANGLTQYFTVPSMPITGNAVEPIPGLPFTFSIDSEGNVIIHNDQSKVPAYFRIENTQDAIKYPNGGEIVPAGEDGIFDGIIDGNKKFVGTTIRAMGKSKYSTTNEDSFGVSKNRLVVADGLGGQYHGELASHLAVESIIANEGSFQQAVQDAQTQLNYHNSNFIKWVTPVYSPDTVLAAAQINGNVIQVAHIGDCRYRLFHKGKTIATSQDHSLVQEKIKAKRITEKEALTDPEGHIVTRTLSRGGADFDTIVAPPGSILMLCTDGLRGVTDEEIINLHAANINRFIVLDEILKLVQLRNISGLAPGVYTEHGLQKVEYGVCAAPCDNITVVFVYF